MHSVRGAALAIILPVLLAACGSTSSPSGSGSGDSGRITMRQYNAVRTGMPYGQVVSVLGTQGTELSRSEIKGVSGVTDDLVTVMYAWQNPDGSNMNVMFQNDKVVSKAQFGLK